MVSRSPVKPKSSSSVLALASRPVASRVWRRSRSTDSSTRSAPAQLGHRLTEVPDFQRPAPLDGPGIGLQLAEQQPQQARLARSRSTPITPIRIPGPIDQLRSSQQRAVAGTDRLT